MIANTYRHAYGSGGQRGSMTVVGAPRSKVLTLSGIPFYRRGN